VTASAPSGVPRRTAVFTLLAVCGIRAGGDADRRKGVAGHRRALMTRRRWRSSRTCSAEQTWLRDGLWARRRSGTIAVHARRSAVDSLGWQWIFYVNVPSVS